MALNRFWKRWWLAGLASVWRLNMGLVAVVQRLITKDLLRAWESSPAKRERSHSSKHHPIGGGQVFTMHTVASIVGFEVVGFWRWCRF